MVVENNLVKMLYCHNIENHFLKIDVLVLNHFFIMFFGTCIQT